VIFTTERFYGLHTVSNDVLALLASRRAEANVARLAIRITFVHGEADIVILKFAIAFKCDTSRALAILAIDAGSQKRVAAFGAEKMLFVICALSELRVVKGDETFVNDWRLAMIATWGEALDHHRSDVRVHRPGL
jgi:hypothetical protein